MDLLDASIILFFIGPLVYLACLYSIFGGFLLSSYIIYNW